jgi:hypothetical protein
MVRIYPIQSLMSPPLTVLALFGAAGALWRSPRRDTNESIATDNNSHL